MSSPVGNRLTVDLTATVQMNKDMTKTILVMHALTGTDNELEKRLAVKTLQTINA